MIAQTLAAREPAWVRSLVSIMSNTGSLRSGQPAFRVLPHFLRRPGRGPDAIAERAVSLFRVIGSPDFPIDEEEIRATVARSFERGGGDIAGTMRQLAAILAAGNRTAELRRIEAPTLVIHGSKDRMIPASGGRATARAIPGARLLLIEGMGHDLPRALWPRLADAIAGHALAAEIRASGPVAAAA
jgi:pimeloyl-ACP methyl ester carboxylesterase